MAYTNDCEVNKFPAKIIAKTGFINDSKPVLTVHTGKRISGRGTLLSGSPSELYLPISIILLFGLIIFKKYFPKHIAGFKTV